MNWLGLPDRRSNLLVHLDSGGPATIRVTAECCLVFYNFQGVGGFGTTDDCALNNGSVVPLTCANGAHIHTGSGGAPRPKVVTRGSVEGTLTYAGDKDPSLEGVTGFSDTPNLPYSTNLIAHQVPQVSGYYGWGSQVYPPNGWEFLGPNKFPDGSFRAIGRTFVRVEDLVQVEADPGFLFLNRNGGQNHPDEFSYSATREYRQILRLIGFEYTKLSGRQLSLNDISLPLGGVFDDKINWTQAHQTHRDGKQVDINIETLCPDPNPANPNGIVECGCSIDSDLFTAVDKYLLPVPKRKAQFGRPPSALLCEDVVGISGRNKHLNMTQLQFFDL